MARDPRLTVACDPAALARVERGRREIEAVAAAYRDGYERFHRGETADPPCQDYGVTTGFGEFKDVPVPPDELERLQRNVLLGHAVGVGDNADPDDPANYFPAEVVRATLVIRLNAFLKGHSGVRVELVRAVEAMVNRGIVPLVPTRGSLGASGDLCPLAHLFAVFLGVGRYYTVTAPGQPARERPWKPAADLAGDLGLPPPQPSYKEGLALCNGATFSAAMLALAVHDAEALANAADAAAALTLEAVCGCARAFDPKIHRARGLAGQRDSAANFRALLAGSRLLDAAPAVQDVYSLRCAPAVHGASRDTVAFARMVAEREINAATDNPLFFPGDEEGEGRRALGLRLPRQLAGGLPRRPPPLLLGRELPRPAGGDGGRLPRHRRRRAGRHLRAAHPDAPRPPPQPRPPRQPGPAARPQLRLHDRPVQRRRPGLREQGAGPPGVGRLDPDLGQHRGPRGDGRPRGAQAAHRPRQQPRRCSPSSCWWRPRRWSGGWGWAIRPTVRVRWERRWAARAKPATEAGAAGKPAPAPADGEGPAAAAAREAWRRADDEAERFRDATLPERREAIAARLGIGTRAVYLAVRRLAEPLLADRPLADDVRRVRRALEDHSLVASATAAATLLPIPALREPTG